MKDSASRQKMAEEYSDPIHPEACHRCGGQNITWFVPSPVWNAVMRHEDGTDEFAIVCPACFVALAEKKGGDRTVWMLKPEQFGLPVSNIRESDGFVWDDEQQLWISPPTSQVEQMEEALQADMQFALESVLFDLKCVGGVMPSTDKQVQEAFDRHGGLKTWNAEELGLKIPSDGKDTH